MLKMAMKLRARAAQRERKTAAAAAEVAAEAAVAAAALAEPLASQKNKVPEKPPKSVKIRVNAVRDVPPEKLLTDKERKKLEKKLLEQKKKEEKKREKERKKIEKMLKKKKKNVPEPQVQFRGPKVAAAAATAGADGGAAAGAAGRGGGAVGGGVSRAWAEWDTDSGEEDAYYAPPRVGGVVWRPGPEKAGVVSVHMPLVVFLVFSVRSPSWVLNFLLQRRTDQGRGCGFVFGATCCFRVFLGCAFFSFLSGRTKRGGRGRGRSRARGTGRRGRDERLI